MRLTKGSMLNFLRVSCRDTCKRFWKGRIRIRVEKRFLIFFIWFFSLFRSSYHYFLGVSDRHKFSNLLLFSNKIQMLTYKVFKNIKFSWHSIRLFHWFLHRKKNTHFYETLLFISWVSTPSYFFLCFPRLQILLLKLIFSSENEKKMLVLSASLSIYWLFRLLNVLLRPHQKWMSWYMTLNYIWWWGFSSGVWECRVPL